jgi:hypothetical protein
VVDGKCYVEPLPLVIFDTLGQQWTDGERFAIERQASDAATKYASFINSNCLYKKSGSCSTITPEKAFYFVLGGPIIYSRSSEIRDYAAEITGQRSVTVYNIRYRDGSVDYSFFSKYGNIGNHETGHIFSNSIYNKTGISPNDVPMNLLRPLVYDAAGNPLTIDHIDDFGRWYGYAGGELTWQFGFGPDGRGNEEFADMHLGWVYGYFDRNPFGIRGTDRLIYMNQQMLIYFSALFGR